MTTVEKIKDAFPHPTIEPIVGQPGYESIKGMHLFLNANAASIISHLGNGRLGLLYLTVQPAVFNTLSAVLFVPPTNPGPTVTYPAGATQHIIRAADIAHATATRLFQQYDATDRALKQQLLGAVDDMFVSALSDPHVGYANVTTLQLLTHLYATYALITDGDLESNKEAMAATYDVNLPIETLFKRIEECVQFAAAGNTPFTAPQVVSTAFRTVQKTGMYTDDCKIWKRKPAQYKTWAQFKVDFTIAHNELREEQQTTRGAGFHANAVQDLQQETATAIANLANATLADRETMTAMQANISTLTTQLSEANAKLVDALNVCTTLKELLATRNSSNGNGGSNGGGRNGGGRNTGGGNSSSSQYVHYCWTHGILSGHTSAECTRKADGHKDEATAADKMGGRTTKWRRYNQ